MAENLGAWLRQQREARAWTKREVARQLIQAGRAAGDTSMPGMDSMCHNIHRTQSEFVSQSGQAQLEQQRERGRAAPRGGEHGNGITALGLGRVRQRRSHRLLRSRKLSDQLGVPLTGACKRSTTLGR
jgi:hypothetical protein